MILHIDPEKVWQGGQRQVVYLVEGLNNAGYRSFIACRQNTPLHQYCKDNNIKHAALDFGKKFNPAALLKLVKFCKDNNIKLVHCHSSYALTIGLQLKILLSRLKLVASRRVDFHIRGRLSGLFKYNNPMLDKLICISENIRKVCQQDGISPKKLKVILSGIDLNRLAGEIPPENFLQKEDLPQYDILIGTIAALVYHKDYPTLIKAAKLTLEKHPQTLFLAFGKGILEYDLKGQCQELGIADRFLFMGFRKDIGWWLNSFDIFSLASKYEGLGTSVLDALACGKPCVCTDGGGIPEMISNEQNGILVPAQNQQKLAAAFCDLIENPQKRERLGNKARQSVKEFSIENTINNHIHLYKELLDGQL
jgi:glycosyltransferase involved in cell wall biosynthesis